MKRMNKTCVDAGTVNCPCPLAETGDCLICSRLSGSDKCDCSWCGLCIYNEFIQNDKKVSNLRNDIKCRIAEKKWYGEDLLILVLDVPRGTALKAAAAGSFVFLNKCGERAYYNLPISVMKVDIQRAQLHLALKVISAKSKNIAEADDFLMVRGIYRSGLLGGGLEAVLKQNIGHGTRKKERWLMVTKGIGLAPAINVLDHAETRANVELVIDPEKLTKEFVDEVVSKEKISEVIVMPLNELPVYHAEDYDKVFILASDHYIDLLTAKINVPEHKLIYSNNFHMCCGEGICGACCHVDENGVVKKMCKCRQKK